MNCFMVCCQGADHKLVVLKVYESVAEAIDYVHSQEKFEKEELVILPGTKVTS